ncbi:MAG: ribosome small subunit-dependent GTPase A [Candidatus Sumerlaeia bacterium]|nr:ribosome small subunit-dependent GTPase A [Candidatus Sumerlaeia bacterium]
MTARIGGRSMRLGLHSGAARRNVEGMKGAVIDSLESLGWNASLEADRAAARAAQAALAGLEPARVLSVHRGWCEVHDGRAAFLAKTASKLFHEDGGGPGLPATGDWVLLEEPRPPRPAAVAAILPRRTALTRKEAGRATRAQTLAANADGVLVVMALVEDFNIARLERYLALVKSSGAPACVVLNKADLLEPEDVAAAVAEVRAVALGAPVATVSAETGFGVERLGRMLEARKTYAMIGSSGAGKSSLANALAGGEVMAVGEVRETDGRGRHTTSHRQMLALPSGALLIDNPGLREVGLYGASEAQLAEVFADLLALAGGCKFRDCRHESEPGCAVLAAIEAETFDPDRLDSYRRLLEEARGVSAAAAKRSERAGSLAMKRAKRR